MGKSDKRKAKVQNELERMVKKGWLYVDGERDGEPVYKYTELGRVIAGKKMKGLGV